MALRVLCGLALTMRLWAPKVRRCRPCLEYDPDKGVLRWSDDSTAARILGVSDAKSVSTLAELDRRLTGEPDKTRQAAFDGNALSYCCEYQLQRDNAEAQWIEERGGWVGSGTAKD